MLIEALIFYVFTAGLLGSALALTLVKNPVHSVLLLILSFFYGAGLLMLLKAEFLALTLIIVYVGAVAVLFLFVVMMLNISNEENRKILSFKTFTIALLLLLILAEIVYYLNLGILKSDVEISGKIALNYAKHNINQIGENLYTLYFYPFLLTGVLLFIAMIGTIALVFRKKEDIYRQNVAMQNAANPAERIKRVKVGFEEGVVKSKEGGKGKGNV